MFVRIKLIDEVKSAAHEGVLNYDFYWKPILIDIKNWQNRVADTFYGEGAPLRGPVWDCQVGIEEHVVFRVNQVKEMIRNSVYDVL